MTVFVPFSKISKEWEPRAQELRNLANVRANERLNPWELAPRVGLHVVDGYDALDFVPEADRQHLLEAGRSSWSGGVYAKPLPNGSLLCILNPKHDPRRNKITLMEEIAHIHLKHVPSSLALRTDDIRIRDFDKSQEEEAYGVGAAALLPWSSFFDAVNSGKTAATMSDDYEVSKKLIEYRIKITGASQLYRARQRRRA